MLKTSGSKNMKIDFFMITFSKYKDTEWVCLYLIYQQNKGLELFSSMQENLLN